ncbi:MAG: SH3 domain-containing protein [Pseudomonadota bacterium]
MATAQTEPREVTLGPVTRRPLPRYVSLRKRANVRRGPGSQHRIDWVFLHPGTPLRVVAEFDVWRKVVDADGAGGWINTFFLLGDRTVIVRVPETGLRAAPRASGRLVAKLQEGVIGQLGRCEGAWCAVTSDGYEGWVNRAAVWGVGPGE